MIEKLKQYILYSLILISLLPCSISIGAQDDCDILPIKSIPDITRPAVFNKNNVLFNNRGIIQRVGKDEVGKKIIVIDDRLFYFTTAAKYYSPEGRVLSHTQFHKGKTVGYLLNDKREITGLYLTTD